MLSKLLLASQAPRPPKQSNNQSQINTNGPNQQKKPFTKGFQFLNSSLHKQLMS